MKKSEPPAVQPAHPQGMPMTSLRGRVDNGDHECEQRAVRGTLGTTTSAPRRRQHRKEVPAQVHEEEVQDDSGHRECAACGIAWCTQGT